MRNEELIYQRGTTDERQSPPAYFTVKERDLGEIGALKPQENLSVISHLHVLVLL